jgi:hypothetical protein
MYIRPPQYSEINFCCSLVAENWGVAAAERCRQQMIEYFKGGEYAPVFAILDIGDPISRDYAPMPIAFTAYTPTMLVKGAFDFVWVAVHRQYQGLTAGKVLTEWRINEITKRGGQMIQLITQKPGYFSKFGFFKLHHVGNDWYIMLKLLKNVDI